MWATSLLTCPVTSHLYLHSLPLACLMAHYLFMWFCFLGCFATVAAAEVTCIIVSSLGEEDLIRVLFLPKDWINEHWAAWISCVLRVVQTGKALQDQQWLFESLMVQVEERRSAVENSAKQIEDRLVCSHDHTYLCFFLLGLTPFYPSFADFMGWRLLAGRQRTRLKWQRWLWWTSLTNEPTY